MRESGQTSLSPEEWSQWTELTKKIQFVDGKIPLEAFYAWSESFYTVAVELVPFRLVNGELEILLINRRDPYFDGYHTPGSILVPEKDTNEVMADLIVRELGPKARVKYLQFAKYYDTMKGDGLGQSPRGQQINLVYTALIEGEVLEGEWFSKDRLPANIIPAFRIMIPEIFNLAKQNLV